MYSILHIGLSCIFDNICDCIKLKKKRSIQLLKDGLFSQGLSFIGRVLVVNSLRASKLWYMLPPQNYISSLQKVFIDFVCHGRHRVKSDYFIYINCMAGWV